MGQQRPDNPRMFVGKRHGRDVRIAPRLYTLQPGRGGDLRTMQELMGHKTITMTLRYSHLSPTHQREAVQRLLQESTATTTTISPKVS
jgi:hypothetical protein